MAAEVVVFQAELGRIREAYDTLLELLEQREAAVVEADRRLSLLGEQRAAAGRHAEVAVAALADAEARAADQALRATALERELEAARALLGERESSYVEVAEPKAACHVRLVSLPTGYALAEAGEPTPPLGAVVEIDGASFIVDGVGRSPLPGDRRECAFLLPSGRALPPSSEDVALDVADSSEQ